MRTIHKYELEIIDNPQVFVLPRGAEVIHAAEQHGGLFMWAVVDTSHDLVDRCFIVRGTGHELKYGMDHVGSVVMPGGRSVWHVFEIPA